MTVRNTPMQDWSELAAGSQVAITVPGGTTYTATVDTKTHDSSVVWVIDAYGQRRAFDHREGVELDADPVTSSF